MLVLCQPPGFPSVTGSLTPADAGTPTPAGSEGPLSPAQQSPRMEQSHGWKAGTPPGLSDKAVRGACPTFRGPRLIYSAAGAKEKQSHRYREQTGGFQEEGSGWKDEIRGTKYKLPAIR